MAHKPEKHMILTVFMLPPGYYKDSWRLPGSRSEELGYLDFVTDLTLMCERAKLDSVFFGDVVTASTILEGNMMTTGLNEPITTLSALAGRTSKIGLTGTVSTSFSLPFVTARQLSGLDSLSGGRAGWNIVTSWMGGENFGIDELPAPAERYRRATEFVDVAVKLWDSWSDQAVINDRASGWWADPAKIQAIDYDGEFFKVAGPLNMRRSPQGRPVLFQAGSSADGMELGATFADVTYTAQPRKDGAAEFYAKYKELVRAKGRDPRSVKVLPGILPIVGETDAEAEEIAKDLANHINFDSGRVQLAKNLEIDIADIDLDERIPAERWSEDPSRGSRYHIFRKLTLDDGLTLRDLVVESYRSGAHLWAVGSASKIADVMVDWFEGGAADGFSLNPPHMPDGLRRICDLLVPELQERGYFRTEYEGDTLREHLGLDRPGAWDTH
ncbi:LLM class flavin-dependent oxidoreductase [Leifsonia kafniensis]|uniref:LLM class flavin-dependent oxidoreductase n=1 Tax=Leifsonia kafniensis TaxID=475957 RepID=A0ABP7KT96_9MICO